MFNVTLCLSMGSLSLLAWLLTACRMSTVCGQLTCARPERLSVTVRTEPEARALGRSLRPLTGLSERKETTAYGGYRLILYRIYGSRAREGRHQGVTLYALGR